MCRNINTFGILLFLISQTGFSQNLKIENYILWKDYYHGDSLITKSSLIEILKTDSLSAKEYDKSETYFYISLGSNVISIISSLYMIQEVKSPDSDFFNKFEKYMIISGTGIMVGVLFDFLSYYSFNNAIRIYNENHSSMAESKQSMR